MVFVTGATGYTGRFVVEALLATGESVRCLVRPSSVTKGLMNQGVSLHEGDLEQPDSLDNALQGCSAVVNVAHIQFASAVIDLCHSENVKRAVFFSSTRRFSKVKSNVDVVVDGEDAVQQSGLDFTLLRPSMIYGPGDDRNVFRLYAYLNRHLLMPIFGGGTNLVQPVFVGDVATAAADTLWRDGTIGKDYTLAGPEPLSYGDMINALITLTGRLVFKVHIPLLVSLALVSLGERLVPNFPLESDLVRRMSEDRAFDITNAKRDLGFMPMSFERGIEKAYKKWDLG